METNHFKRFLRFFHAELTWLLHAVIKFLDRSLVDRLIIGYQGSHISCLFLPHGDLVDTEKKEKDINNSLVSVIQH